MANKKKAKRIIKEIDFDFKGSHIAYTDMSQGGAASLKNEPYLLKSEDDSDIKLTKEQKDILSKIGEESTPLDKSKSEDVDNINISSQEDELNKTKEEDKMSKDLLDKLEALEKQLAKKDAEMVVSKYDLEEEVSEKLTKALAEASEDLRKSVDEVLNSIFKSHEAALEKAKEEVANEALEKSKETKNELQKSLDEEAGHESATDQAELSVVEKALEIRNAKLKKGAK